jgi:glutathione S-transferase
MNTVAFPGVVTALAVLVYMLFTMNAGRNRVKHKIVAPAVTGSEGYERAYRVQMNTLEHLAIFLPSLWLYGYSQSYDVAAWIGLGWIAGRVLYGIGYVVDPAKRGPGMFITLGTELWLLFGGLYGFTMLMMNS